MKKGQCFTHFSRNTLIKSGTYFSALSYDDDFIAAATCDPANVNNLDNPSGNEKVFLFDIKEMNVSKVIDVPMFVSVTKLIHPEWIICGHFDGKLTAWKFQDENLTQFKGHTADVLTVDVNLVSSLYDLLQARAKTV